MWFGCCSSRDCSSATLERSATSAGTYRARWATRQADVPLLAPGLAVLLLALYAVTAVAAGRMATIRRDVA